jgi:hypothetical protein
VRRTVAPRTTKSALRRTELVLAEISAVDDQGRPWIRRERGGESVQAAATVAVRPEDLGRRATVLFDGATPIVTGVVRFEAAAAEGDGAGLLIRNDDGELSCVATRAITLRCGPASVTLSPDGTVRIKGTNVATTASGQNRIRGASVKIN